MLGLRWDPADEESHFCWASFVLLVASRPLCRPPMLDLEATASVKKLKLEADCPLFGSRVPPWEPGLQSLTVTHDPCLGDGTGPAAHDAHDVEAALGGEEGGSQPSQRLKPSWFLLNLRGCFRTMPTPWSNKPPGFVVYTVADCRHNRLLYDSISDLVAVDQFEALKLTGQTTRGRVVQALNPIYSACLRGRSWMLKANLHTLHMPVSQCLIQYSGHAAALRPPKNLWHPVTSTSTWATLAPPRSRALCGTVSAFSTVEAKPPPWQPSVST